MRKARTQMEQQFNEDGTSDFNDAATLLTDPGSSISRVLLTEGNASSSPSTDTIMWDSMDSNALMSHHTPTDVYDLLTLAAASANLTADQKKEAYHYLGVPGIEKWFEKMQMRKLEQQARRDQLRQQASQQQAQREALEKKR